MQVIGADPVGSILKALQGDRPDRARPTPTRSRAWARTSSPPRPTSSVIDRVVSLRRSRRAQPDAPAGARGRRSSSAARRGMAAWVALEVARRARRRATWWWCCSPTPASATCRKVHNDAWMRDNHLLRSRAAHAGRRSSCGQDARVPALLSSRSRASRCAQRARADRAATTSPRSRCSAASEVVGTLYDSDIAQGGARRSHRRSSRPVEDMMGEPARRWWAATSPSSA